MYDLEVPSSMSVEEQEAFKPKPLDGEVEHFEVSQTLMSIVERFPIVTFLFQLLPLSEIIERMHKKLFKPNCAIGDQRTLTLMINLKFHSFPVLINFLIRKGLITPENEANYLEIVTRMHGRFEYNRW